MSLAKNNMPKTTLSFPGKLSLKKSGDKLAISDTGHHRILIVNTGGIVETVVGGGLAGFVDGGFEQAQFNSPQGVAWKSDVILFVADTENHAIRMVTLLLVTCLFYSLKYQSQRNHTQRIRLVGC